MIAAMLPDNDSVWIGTFDGTLLRHDKKGETFQTCEEVEVIGLQARPGKVRLGKPGEGVNGIAADERFLYIASCHGLFIHSKNDGVWWWCSMPSPALSIDVDETSICCGGREGRLWQYRKSEIFERVLANDLLDTLAP